MFQEDIFSVDIIVILAPIFSLILLLFLMVLMILFFTKKRIFVIILAIYLFSLVIGIRSFEVPNFPFNPYFQTFFLIFQTIFLLISSVEVFKYGKG